MLTLSSFLTIHLFWHAKLFTVEFRRSNIALSNSRGCQQTSRARGSLADSRACQAVPRHHATRPAMSVVTPHRTTTAGTYFRIWFIILPILNPPSRNILSWFANSLEDLSRLHYVWSVHVSIKTEIAVVTSFTDAVEKLSFHDFIFCTPTFLPSNNLP